MEEQNREVWVGKNRIHLGEDNIVYFTAVGEHNGKMAIEINDAIMKVGEMFEEKVNVLIDLNNARKPSPEARKIFKEGIELEKAGKIAFLGIHPVARMLASFGVGMSRKKDLRFFKTKEEALAWLMEGE